MLQRLIVWAGVCGLLSAGPAPAEGPGDLPDRCRYSGDRQAQAVWRAVGVSDPVHVADVKGRKALRLPCSFRSRPDIQRERWARAVTLDLSEHAGIEFDMYCPSTAPIRHFTVSLGGDGGWRVKTIRPAELPAGWSTIRVRKAQTTAEGNPPGWANIRAIRISAERLSSDDTEFYIADLRILPADSTVPLTRLVETDRVELTSGEVVACSVLNERYFLITQFGNLAFPAGRVVGFTSRGQSGGLRLVLTDGQVLGGRLSGGEIRIALGVDDVRTIPVKGVRQMAYRVSALRPEQAPPAAPSLVVNDSWVAYSGEDLHLTLQTLHGAVGLPTSAMARVEGIGDGRHRAHFRNGSVLTGTLDPAGLQVQLAVGPRANIETRRVSRFIWSAWDTAEAGSATVVLRNKDRLVGRLTSRRLSIKGDFGAVEVDTGDILSVTLSRLDVGMAVTRLWGGATIRGRLLDKTIGLAIQPDGPTLQIKAAEILAITSAEEARASASRTARTGR